MLNIGKWDLIRRRYYEDLLTSYAQDTSVVQKATNAFFTYGGKPICMLKLLDIVSLLGTGGTVQYSGMHEGYEF